MRGLQEWELGTVQGSFGLSLEEWNGCGKQASGVSEPCPLGWPAALCSLLKSPNSSPDRDLLSESPWPCF